MRLHRLATGSSLAVLAALLAARPLHAAAFAGTPVTGFGSVTVNRATPNVDTVTVNTVHATVNWTPTDTGPGPGSIDFLPAGTTANYVAGPAVTGAYTVLNRIIAADPSRRIDFNGAVNSAAGGSVWFYAPGGLLIGSGAVFNVGSLLLTTADPVTDVTGEFQHNVDATHYSFSVASPSGSPSQISIAAGAQINALNTGSYVVAVAPRIDQSGTINVNGSAALVGAESVDFTYNAGLYDISVTQGSTAGGTSFTHTGTTTGPASSGAGDYHRIYLVAVPKNTAMTMFIGGPNNNLGFDVAGAADVVGNAIVLSAGHNIHDTGSGSPIVDAVANPTAAGLNIDQGHYTSQVIGRSNGDTFAGSFGGNTSYAGDVSLRGVANAGVSALAGFNLTIAGNLTLSADAVVPDLVTSVTAGMSNVGSQAGSTLTIGGNAVVTASTTNPFSASTGGSAGGTARISPSGGNVSIAGNATVRADGSGPFSGTAGASGTGGLAQVLSNGGSVLTIGGTTTVSADGIGGDDVGGVGGSGLGGRVDINAHSGGALNLVGNVVATASGVGGISTGGTAGGNGTGGQVYFGAGSGVTTASSSVSLDASGDGGLTTQGSGGIGAGGTAAVGNFDVTAQTLIAGSITANANGVGGLGTTTGGAGIGGNAGISPNGGIVRTTGGSGAINLFANAVGGNGSAGGSATGGQAYIGVDGGTFQTGYATTIQATANGGGGSPGGNATGGHATIDADNGGQIQISGATTLLTRSRGGSTAAAGAVGGTGTGGTSGINVGVGAVTLTGALSINAQGYGGNASTGGVGVGGNINVTTNIPGGLAAINSAGNTLLFTASGFGGTGDASTGTGGAAVGGTTFVSVNGGPLTIDAMSVQLQGSAYGGTGATGGAASGGTAEFQGNSALLRTTGAAFASAAGLGGAGSNGNGGNAIGGGAAARSFNTGAGGIDVPRPARSVGLRRRRRGRRSER